MEAEIPGGIFIFFGSPDGPVIFQGVRARHGTPPPPGRCGGPPRGGNAPGGTGVSTEEVSKRRAGRAALQDRKRTQLRPENLVAKLDANP